MDATGLFLLLITTTPSLVYATDIWHVSLAYGPAPPPDQRPPFSRNATYDPSQLKYQVPAIVGSYLGVVFIIGFCLISFGRRWRREAQGGRAPVSREMVRQQKPYDATPTSPQGSVQALWGRWASPRLGSTKSQHSDKSPVISGPVSFDPHVIQNDKVARQDEMERIYAQIMGQDTKTPKSVSVNESEVYTSDDLGGFASNSRAHERKTSAGTKASSHRQSSQRHSDASAFQLQYSQRPTGQGQAAYPPHGLMPSDPNTATTAGPGFTGYHSQTELVSSPPPVPPPSSRPLDPTSPRHMPPPYSHIRQGSGASGRSKRSGRGSIRGLPISAPIPIPDPLDEPQISQPMTPASPRTPRWYKDPGRPPTPPIAALRESVARPHTPFEDISDTEIEKMRSPGIPRGRSERRIPDYASSDEDVIETDEEDETHVTESIAHGYNDLSSPLPPPSAAPQRQNGRTPPPPSLTLSQASPAPHRDQQGLSISRNNTPGGISRTTTPGTISRTNTPGALSLRSSQNKTPAGSSTNTLPFRAFHPPPQLNTSAAGKTMSPGPIKTTFLSPRRDRFLPGGMHAIGPHGIVPNTAALLSAGLATPYSPYMPFSPMTPVTPHLVNRRERKQADRERGRQAVTEEDIVQDEKDIWGDGY